MFVNVNTIIHGASTIMLTVTNVDYKNVLVNIEIMQVQRIINAVEVLFIIRSC